MNNDPRFGDLIRTDLPSAREGNVVIIGIPTDEGIRRNGGREGAAQAPDEIRKYFRKLTPVSKWDPHTDISRPIFDHGNITGLSLEEIHHRSSTIIQEYISRGCFVISLGGGHDITYPLVKGVRDGLQQKPGLINIDAHLDVREKKNGLHHSGSSFRLLLEEEIIRPEFNEFGIQSHSVARSHIEWLERQKGSLVDLYEEIRDGELEEPFESALSYVGANQPWYFSFDIDSVRSSDAPGCSAPSPIGFTAEEAIWMCYKASNSQTLVAMDIVEVSPPFDKDARTSRLAARMMAAAISGLL